MKVTYEHKNELTFIGFHTEIAPDEGYKKCPEFWDKEYAAKYALLWQTMKPGTEIEKAILENGIGMYAICADGENGFTYWIAGLYKGGDVPEGLELFTFPESDWAIFTAKGPIPQSLQTLNTQVWNEWAPNIKTMYEIGTSSIEFYSAGNPQSPDYECGIWVPIKEKANLKICQSCGMPMETEDIFGTNADGSLKDGDPYGKIEYARNALCAWCSVPDKKKESDPAVDFGYLSEQFPELVNASGEGWYWQHVKNVIRFVRKHPTLTSVNAQKACEKISRSFTREWQKQVRKFQVPIFALNTKGAWTLRFDDILADALEAGPLRTAEYLLSEDIAEKIRNTDLNDVPFEVVSDVVCFCLANKQEDTDWIVLPVGSFDAYYGNTYFSRKWFCKIPNTILERSPQKCGVCRVRVTL